MVPDPYGRAHRRTRDALLPYAYGTACPLCGEVMLHGQALDLDHSLPVMKGGGRGDRIAHASCNRRAGAALRWGAARERRLGRSSRRW